MQIRSRDRIHAELDRTLDKIGRAIVTAVGVGIVIGVLVGGFLVWLTMK